ncbi:hypothetical protein JCM3770_005430 [Rhodotorula araucariae]
MPSVNLPSLAGLWQDETAQDRLKALEDKHSTHPLFLPIDGTPDSSDDGSPPLRTTRGKRRARHTAGTESAQKKHTLNASKLLDALEPPKGKSRPTTPAGPIPPLPAPTKLPFHASSPIQVERTDTDDELPAPAASPSPPAKRRAEVLELSSASEDEVESSSPPPVRATRHSTVRAATSADLLRKQRYAAPAGLAKSADVKTSRASAAKKPRLSREQAVEKAKKLKPDKLLEHFPTISNFIEHLVQYDPEPTNRAHLLAGCRFVFVNTDHWRSTRATPTRNRFDQTLRLNMAVAAKNGAALVKPEDFVPPPFDVDDDAPGPDTTGAEAARAAQESWTTHIIPLELPGQRAPTYDEVLACLGPGSGGIARDELGRFVHVVSFRWVSEWVTQRARPAEWEFALKGDFRAAARRATERQDEAAAALRKRRREREREKRKEEETDKARRRRQGARGRKGDLQQEDTEGESDEDDYPVDGVSPLGPDDWPDGEAPPAGYFDVQPSQSSASSSLPKRVKSRQRDEGEVVGGGRATAAVDDAEDADDPIDDPDRTRTFTAAASTTVPKGSPPRAGAAASTRIGDLAEEFAIIRAHGAEAVDELLDASVQDLLEHNPNLILSTRAPDGFETDNENSDGGYDPQSFDPKRDRAPRTFAWACDNPAANRARRDGPNETTAQMIELLAALIPKVVDKDDFRVRTHKQAANKLRSYRTKLDRFDQLVKIRGIGPKMARKIIEINRTGTHRRLSKFETDADKAHKLFSGIYGVSSATAQDLYAAGARSIADLRREPARFGFTKAASMIGLEYYEDLLDRIPRAEMTELYEAVRAIAREIDPKLVVECMGSYRRGADSSGDIDLLVTRDPADGKTHEGMVRRLWRRLRKAGIAQYELSTPEGWDDLDAKINGLCKLPREGAKMRRIDVLGVPWDEMPAAMIYFTGNDHFNRSLRLKARRHGYRLNQRGLYKDVSRDPRSGDKLTEGVRVKGIESERDIFRVLKVQWCRPEERIP